MHLCLLPNERFLGKPGPGVPKKAGVVLKKLAFAKLAGG